MAKERIQYFDILKGVAIFLVVMGHVLTMCIREIDNAFLFKLIGRVHMPIFFFISGYLTYKQADEYQFIRPKLGKRAIQLLTPFVVVSMLWVMYYPHSGLHCPFNASLRGWLFSAYKLGYWFTPTLFLIILFYCISVPILNRIKNDIVILLLVFVTMCIVNVGFGWAIARTGVKLSELFMIEQFVIFCPVFFVGVLANKNRVLLNKMLCNGRSITIALIVGSLLLYFSCYRWEFDVPSFFIIDSIECLLRNSLVVLVAIYIAKKWSDNVYSINPLGNRMSKIWTYMGRESLGIYLLHFFFLFPLSFLQQPMRDMGLGFVPCLVVSIVFAAAIVAVTLGVNYIISQSKLLSLLLTGKNQYR